MSEEHSQREDTVELHNTIATLQTANAELSAKLAQMQNIINEQRHQMSNMEMASKTNDISGDASISIAPIATESSASGSVTISQSYSSTSSTERYEQQQIVTIHEPVSVVNAFDDDLWENMLQLQKTVDDQRGDIFRLTAENVNLRSSYTDLRASNSNLTETNKQMTSQIRNLENSGLKLRLWECKRSRTVQTDLLRSMLTAPSATASTNTGTTTGVPSTPSNANNPFRPAANVPSYSPVAETEMKHPQPSYCTNPATETIFFPKVINGVSSPVPNFPAICTEIRESLSKEIYDAANTGNAQRIYQLVAEGAGLEYRDERGNIALHRAVWKGHVDAVNALINSAASLNGKSIYKITPMQYEDCVKELLSMELIVNTRNYDGSIPLHFAAYRGFQSIVEILIAAGGDRGAQNKWGTIPKDLATNCDIIALL